MTGSHKEFIVTDGEKTKLFGKGLYFLRTTGDRKDPSINVNNINEGEVQYGEISQHMITSLNTIINQVYKPLVEKLDANDWGVCEEEQRKDFNHVFDKFSIELKEALKSL